MLVISIHHSKARKAKAMTRRRALEGKLHAGNLHMRFDAVEIASCAEGALLRRTPCRRQLEGRASGYAAIPRRGSLLCKNSPGLNGAAIAVAMQVIVMMLFSGQSLADVTQVSSAGRVYISSGASFQTHTESVEEYPLQVEPMFWLDASMTNSWKFNDQGEILEIPSRSASARYLTSRGEDIVYQNYSQNLWYDSVTYSKIKKPSLSPAGNGIKGSYVDFGEPNSRKVLFFNPVSTGENASLSNTLSGIGTIVGVYRSVRGSGNILGGKCFSRLIDYWNKGTNLLDAVVYTGKGNDHITRGVFWTGLQKSAPASSYWSGDWQVIALNPTNANVLTHGLCGNCEEHDEYMSAGGQNIAELMLFDRVLPDTDITNLVVYLERKWLGRSPSGYNGNARISWLEVGGVAADYPQDGVDVPITVAAGDTLTIDNLAGGRSTVARKHRIVKDGSGTIRLNGASTFGGIVDVKAGTLSLGGRRTPTLSELPPGVCIRFDPSEDSSLTLNGSLVSAMANLGNSGKYPVTAVQETASLQPELVADTPCPGLNLVDFKEFNSTNGRYLRFNTSSAPKIGTLILVVDSSTYTGAHIMDGMFMSRTTESVRFFIYDQWNQEKALFFTPNDVSVGGDHSGMSPLVYGNAWVNGKKVVHETEAYDVPGLNVIALRVPAAAVHGLCGVSAQLCGGVRIGEVLGWAYALSDEQMLDVQAYLMDKWLARSAPGYASATPSGVADVQEVVAEENARIHVSAGEVATIGHLVASGTVYKVGAGTLKLQHTTDTATRLVVSEGDVVRAAEADVDSKCEIAKEPTLHFDPSKSWTVRTPEQGGTNYVWTLMDARGLVSATETMQSWRLSVRPFLDDGADDYCNGLQTINFGPMICGYNADVGAFLKLTRNITNVRSVYLVLGSQEGGGNPLGSNSSRVTLGSATIGGKRLDFYRGFTSDDSLKTKPLWGTASPSVKNGILYVNGVLQSNAAAYIPNGGYELVELHLPAGTQFNAIGNGFESYVHGGFRMGEMLVYERVLTDRERVATRNHLLKKWFAKTDAELADLPAKPDQDPIGYSFQRIVVDFNDQGIDCRDAIISLPQGVEFELRNIGNLAYGSEVPVLIAAGLTGTENLQTSVFSGDIIPANAKIKFRIDGGTLYARCVKLQGMRVIFR